MLLKLGMRVSLTHSVGVCDRREFCALWRLNDNPKNRLISHTKKKTIISTEMRFVYSVEICEGNEIHKIG